jgi:hypothetical protein
LKTKWHIVLFFVIGISLACSKKEISNTNNLLGLDYYPLTIGKYVIYEVDSLVYGVLPRDTSSYKYQIKEVLVESFTDAEGKTAYKLHRYIKKFDPKKKYDSIPWQIKEVWMVNASLKNIQVVESNKRYTKLIFPIEDKATWNGNAGNTEGERLYTYNYIDKNESFNNSKFENVLMVKQFEYRTLISYENYVEKYAKGVGLVYREIKNIVSQDIKPGVAVDNRIESGLVYKQTYIAHGYE